MVNIIVHELAGVNIIYMYSNTIFKQIFGPGSFFTPRTGTYVVSIANFASYGMATWTVKSFGRKPLLFWGHIGIAIAHALIGAFIITGFDFGVVMMICVFICIYANTTGPIAWVYLAETCTDIGIGVGLWTLWAVVFIQMLTTPVLMNSALKPQGVFFMMSILSLGAAGFIYYWIRETRGLTDKEKRSVF